MSLIMTQNKIKLNKNNYNKLSKSKDFVQLVVFVSSTNVQRHNTRNFLLCRENVLYLFSNEYSCQQLTTCYNDWLLKFFSSDTDVGNDYGNLSG